MVGNGLGLISYNPVDYPRRPDGTFLSHFDKCLLRKRVRDIKPGDVIIFNDHYHPCHCGIVATKHGEVSVIHAHAGRGRVIHERLSEARSVVGRPVRAYEFPGLED